MLILTTPEILFAALKRKQRKIREKNRRFVVTEFVKKYDELVTGLEKRKEYQKNCLSKNLQRKTWH